MAFLSDELEDLYKENLEALQANTESRLNVLGTVIRRIMKHCNIIDEKISASIFVDKIKQFNEIANRSSFVTKKYFRYNFFVANVIPALGDLGKLNIYPYSSITIKQKLEDYAQHN